MTICKCKNHKCVEDNLERMGLLLEEQKVRYTPDWKEPTRINESIEECKTKLKLVNKFI